LYLLGIIDEEWHLKLLNFYKLNNRIMSLKFNPGADRVVIEPAAAEEKTASGIIIPDTAKEKPQKGKIVAVGPGKVADVSGLLIPMSYKIGDEVLYGKYAGTELPIEGKEYLIMRESDIYGTYLL
jgi:chaperonin GroES